jgi:DNA-binding NarL/FixJ family response regulator
MSQTSRTFTIPAEQFEAEAARLSSLTFRERDVSILVSEGLSNKQIGEQLFISAVTVRHHLTSIFRKLDFASRFELIVLCYRHRLVVPAVGPVSPERETTRVAGASAGAGAGSAAPRAR